jgi:hypothetical protein
MTESNLAGQIDALRKMRLYHLQNIAEAAEQIKAIDCEIERTNMENLGDDGL